MEQLLHGIAIVLGFIIYMATKNIVIAAVVAVILEGIILAVMAALPRIRSGKEQFAAWQAGTAAAPPLKKLGWRVVLLVVFGLWAVMIIIPCSITIIDVINSSNFQGSKTLPVLALTGMILVMGCLPLILIIINFIKAKKWNKTIQQAQSSGQSEKN
jgi:energy-converting hydrogenase Eha subunit A